MCKKLIRNATNRSEKLQIEPNHLYKSIRKTRNRSDPLQIDPKNYKSMSPLSVGEELAIDHASREAEMDHDLWRLILCEALRSATRDRQTSSLTRSTAKSESHSFRPSIRRGLLLEMAGRKFQTMKMIGIFKERGKSTHGVSPKKGERERVVGVE